MHVAQLAVDGSLFDKVFVGEDLEKVREKARQYLRENLLDESENGDPLNAEVLNRLGAGFKVSYNVEIL